LIINTTANIVENSLLRTFQPSAGAIVNVCWCHYCLPNRF